MYGFIIGVLLISLFGLFILCYSQREHKISVKDLKGKTTEQCLEILRYTSINKWPGIPGEWHPTDEYSIRPPTPSKYVEQILDKTIKFQSSGIMNEEGRALNYGFYVPHVEYLGYLGALNEGIKYSNTIRLKFQ